MLPSLFHSSNPVVLPGSRVKVLFGPGALDRLGELCKSLGGNRVLLVTDPGIEISSSFAFKLTSIGTCSGCATDQAFNSCRHATNVVHTEL